MQQVIFEKVMVSTSSSGTFGNVFLENSEHIVNELLVRFKIDCQFSWSNMQNLVIQANAKYNNIELHIQLQDENFFGLQQVHIQRTHNETWYINLIGKMAWKQFMLHKICLQKNEYWSQKEVACVTDTNFSFIAPSYFAEKKLLVSAKPTPCTYDRFVHECAHHCELVPRKKCFVALERALPFKWFSEPNIVQVDNGVAQINFSQFCPENMNYQVVLLVAASCGYSTRILILPANWNSYAVAACYEDFGGKYGVLPQHQVVYSSGFTIAAALAAWNLKNEDKSWAINFQNHQGTLSKV